MTLNLCTFLGHLESLSDMVHFFQQELELSHNCAKQQVKAWGRFFLSDLKFTAIHSLK